MSETTTLLHTKIEKEINTQPPDLTTHPAKTDEDLISALRLIADSVAQQRQVTAKAIIFHPLWLGTMFAALAVVYQVLYRSPADLALVGTTWAGCLMAGLMGVRVWTGGYIERAEKVGTWDWLWDGMDVPDTEVDMEKQVVLVTRFGGRVIGALVVRGVDAVSGQGKRQRKGVTVTVTTGVIRAWTVQQRYRRNGVGMDLLEGAVAVCRERRWRGPVFDEEHANSKRFGPGMFYGGFERREKRAREVLEKLISRAVSKA